MTTETEQEEAEAIKEMLALVALSTTYSMIHHKICEDFAINENSDLSKKILEILKTSAEKEHQLMIMTRSKIKELIKKSAH